MKIRTAALVTGTTALVAGAFIGLSGTAGAVPVAVIPTPLHPGIGPIVVHYNPLLHPVHPFRLTAPIR